MRQVVACLVVMVVVAMSMVESRRPPYIECETSDECGKESCCVIGMGRYSIPTCRPRRDKGEECRPSSLPSNTTLSYPDGATVHLHGVYYVHCPCLGGLTCEDVDDSPLCTDSPLSNHIDDYYSLPEDSAQRSWSPGLLGLGK